MSVSEQAPSRGSSYGWVIVVASTMLLVMQSGIMYSFGVFFKPLAAEFGWSRAATSGAYSTLMLTHGLFAVPVGWLADRFGPARVETACAVMAGLGLVLASRITELWQLYIAYGLISGIGISGGFPIGTGTTARWFDRRRGLTLGIVATGIGLGTLLMVPIIERLIADAGWSVAYLRFGIIVWVAMIGSALLLRRGPAGTAEQNPRKDAPPTPAGTNPQTTMSSALRTKSLWLLFVVYLFFNSGVQMIMVHLVNYTTDLGIAPQVAATIVSVVGIGSIAGRLSMGAASDKFGGMNMLIICCSILALSLLAFIFTRSLWTFYALAVVFGLAYGGEWSILPTLVGHFFGFRLVSALVGVVVTGATIGGAFGSWAAGQIFDATQSYQVPFTIGVFASVCAVVLTFVIKRTTASANKSV
ncbi:MAG: MFS transporter [Dehalococcoidales bacterium]|nr:MFS transporter [Dehalococcoidales bacterium]